jgi:hypothetical protein
MTNFICQTPKLLWEYVLENHKNCFQEAFVMSHFISFGWQHYLWQWTVCHWQIIALFHNTLKCVAYIGLNWSGVYIRQSGINVKLSRCVSFYCLNSVLKLPWLGKTIETHHSERQSSPFKEFQMLCAQQEENSVWFSQSFISHLMYSLSSCKRLESCSSSTFLRNYSGYNNNNYKNNVSRSIYFCIQDSCEGSQCKSLL